MALFWCRSNDNASVSCEQATVERLRIRLVQRQAGAWHVVSTHESDVNAQDMMKAMMAPPAKAAKGKAAAKTTAKAPAKTPAKSTTKKK